MEETTGLIKNVAELVASYVVETDPFGAEEWMKYYGVDVGPEADLPEEFYQWWLSSDVYRKDKLNCETHLSPVLRPRSRYTFYSEAYEQHSNTKAGPARWLVMRKDVFARNKSYAQQKEFMRNLNKTGADYDEMPSALDLATIVFATHVRTGGDRHLGDATGEECKRLI